MTGQNNSRQKKAITEFIEDKWSVETGKTPKYLPNENFTSKPVLTDRKMTIFELFLNFFTPTLFGLMKTIVNNNLVAKFDDISDGNRKYYKPVTTESIMKWYAAYLKAEQMKSPEYFSVDIVLKVLNNLVGKPVIGQHRYHAIMASLVPSETEMESLFVELRKNFIIQWGFASEICIDESIFPYHPSKETKQNSFIPIHYIERKPHPEGLFSVNAVVQSFKTKRKYLIDFEGHYKLDNLTPREAKNQIMDRYTNYHPKLKTHVITDAGYGEFDLDNEKYFTTTSISSSGKPFLWDLLLTGAGVKMTRQVSNGKVIVSVMADVDKDGGFKYHKLCTNAYSIIADNKITSDTQSEIDDDDNNNEDTQILPPEKKRAIDAVAINNSSSSVVVIQLPNQMPIRLNMDVTKPAEIIQKEKEMENMPEDLRILMSKSKFRAEDLKELCLKYGISTKGSKQKIIERVTKFYDPKNFDLEKQVERSLVETSFNREMHELYCEHFNYVDIYNKNFYQFDYTYPMHSWQTKMFLSYLKYAIINAWVVWCEDHEEVSLLDFRLEVINRLISFNE